MQWKDDDREFYIQLRRALLTIDLALLGLIRWIEHKYDLKPTDR